MKLMMPIKLSPVQFIAEKWQGRFVELDGWQVVQSFSSVELETAVAQTAVGLCDQSHNGKFYIEGMAAGAMLAAEELAINTGRARADGYQYRLRPDLYFVSTSAEKEALVDNRLTEMARAAESLVTVTNFTHGNGELWLVGPNSVELLSRLCGLDFYDSHFPNGTAKQSSVAKTNQLVIRRDQSDVPAYALIGARSLAAYLWQTIMDAGRDLGIQPIGLQSCTSSRSSTN